MKRKIVFSRSDSARRKLSSANATNADEAMAGIRRTLAIRFSAAVTVNMGRLDGRSLNAPKKNFALRRPN